jgi:tRNA U34 5-methylaminomethyl-2-thiouridine-forming methyltransferase MnmC
MGAVAYRRLLKLLPDPESQLAMLPPVPVKPADLRRLAARMHAGRVPKEAVPVSVEEIEWDAKYQKRAIWVWRKMRAIEARLKPLWEAEEAECERIEQMVFHETKRIVSADHCSGMNDSFQTMKRAFRASVRRR